ncbi:MAG: class I SAM-dependent methyltransferase [Treponema sp.]|jgi:SAM-dependent methyltransferase|nr:class I SAM-dependent methyltransferase [Treponema sp.]
MTYRKEWFNDGEFWETFAPIMFDDSHWKEVPAAADGLIHLAALDLDWEREGAEAAGDETGKPRCLDQCCGFGRISLEMARRGFGVTGVDITESYLETARDDAAYENLSTEFVREDVRSFCRKNYFDLAYNVYTSFGYFEDPADDARVIKNAFDSLKAGGTYVIETLGKEIAVRDFVQADWFERAGFYVLTAYEAADSWSSLKNRWVLISQRDQGRIKRGDIIEKNFVQRLYGADTLQRLFRDTGFNAVEICGGWDGRNYDEDALSLIVSGKKPAGIE